MSFLFYKRPRQARKEHGHLSECKSGTRDCSSASIPPELSFERVVCNRSAPPCSLQDFLDYQTYISHDAENLQFYLWMIDYFQRFRRIPKMERALSPRWTGRAPPIREQDGLRMIATHDVDILSEDISDCDTWGAYEVSEAAFTDQYTQTLDDIKFSISPVKGTPHPNPSHSPQQTRAEQYVWHPAESQPLRPEITRIINHYLNPGSPRQLNLSHNDRATVLRALEYTTHPSALSPIKRMLDSTLRAHSHPNFIRWSICNGNRTWIIFLRFFSAFMLTLGFVIAILLILGHASRYYRILAAPFWWFGITNAITASRGLCPLLHGMHTRQNHAWEAKDDLPDDEEMLKTDFSTVVGSGGAICYEGTRPAWSVKMEVFGPANNYSGEKWVRLQREKTYFRRLWDYRVRVQKSEKGLSWIQNRMIRQAEVWALIATVPLTVGLCVIPNANLI